MQDWATPSQNEVEKVLITGRAILKLECLIHIT